MRALVHGRVTLGLHELRAGGGRPLLHIHGLGLRTPGSLPADLASWTGPVFGLDLTGHGASTVPRGGGYTPEVLIGDVDAAVRHLGEVTLVGRGLGAYLALLSAGALAGSVRGAILCDGPGITGGGPAPGTPQVARIDPDEPAPPDPFALAELGRDLRPPDYATAFVRLAVEHCELATPVAVCAKARPDWLRAVAEEPGVITTSLAEALAVFSV